MIMISGTSLSAKLASSFGQFDGIVASLVLSYIYNR